jgi:outer membrane protein OmpA-like peptidoglycan-associated protein
MTNPRRLIPTLIALAAAAACHQTPSSAASTTAKPATQPTQQTAQRTQQAGAARAGKRAAGARNRRPLTPAARAALARADSIKRVNQARATAFDMAREARMDSIQTALVVKQRQAVVRADLLVPIHFDEGKADVVDADQKSLDRKVAILEANPDLTLRIEAVVDDTGADAGDQDLAMQRATAIQQYLVAHGVAAGRLSITATPDTTDWASDPRADFVITGGEDQLTPP